jgi:hypothetical protein
MTKPALKEKLHEYIEHADESKVLAIYTLVENEIEDRSDLYNEATLNSFRAISEDYFSGKTKGYTVEESMNRIRKQISKK